MITKEGLLLYCILGIMFRTHEHKKSFDITKEWGVGGVTRSDKSNSKEENQYKRERTKRQTMIYKTLH
jgi:hypothetical protein